jgi:hypothetical protein
VIHFHHQVIIPLFTRCIYVRVFAVKKDIKIDRKKLYEENQMTWPGFELGTLRNI